MPIVVPAHIAALGGHPTYWQTQEKQTHKGLPVEPNHCCVLCGRKALGNKRFVMLTNIGEYTFKEEPSECDDLGLYPIGSECLKVVTAAGVPVYDRDYNHIAGPVTPTNLKPRD